MKDASPAIKLNDIIEATGGLLLRQGKRAGCSEVSTDTRTIAEGALFIPLRGRTYDGHDYLEDALNRGAAAVLAAKGYAQAAESLSGDASIIIVDDTLKALGDLAYWWRRRFDGPVIAVTGSSGKTTTKEMIALIGERSLKIHKNSGNLNNCIGFPLSLLRLTSAHGAGVYELASNHPGEIARLADIAGPDVAVITNVGPAHLQGFHSLEAVREEKGSILSFVKPGGMAVINRDDANIRILEDRWKGKSISFGIAERATVKAEHIFTRGDTGVSFTIKIGGLSRGIDMTTLGIHNIYNALAAAAASWAVGVPFDEICAGLVAFRQVPGRMTVTRLASGATLIDDSYNANPASTAAALKTLAAVKGAGTAVVIFGDMLELGDESEEKHREAGDLIASTGVDFLFVTGKQALAVAEGARLGGMDAGRIHAVENPREMRSLLRTIPRADLWILVKGSRAMKMERFCAAISDDLEGKALPTDIPEGGEAT